MFCKKSVLKNFTKLTGKHLWQSFFNKVVGWRYANLLKKTPAQVFSLYFATLLRTPNTSGGCFWRATTIIASIKCWLLQIAGFNMKRNNQLKWFTALQDNYVKILNWTFLFSCDDLICPGFTSEKFLRKKQQQDFLKFGFLLWLVMMNSWIFKIPIQIKSSTDVIMLTHPTFTCSKFTSRHLPARRKWRRSSVFIVTF